MILKNCDISEFFDKIQDKQLVCFGVGHDIEEMIKNNYEYAWAEKISFLVDNDSKKYNNTIIIQNRAFFINSVQELINKVNSQTVILITCSFYYEIVKQLNTICELDMIECYIYNFMLTLVPAYELTVAKEKISQIPPIIHYCWFGKKPLPLFYKSCIESWRKYCPEYEIIEWNESNCDITENQYAWQAYKNGKYGFVPDYFRLKIIYENGGIYLDTDVELIRSLDSLRKNKAFCGIQLPGEVALGLGFGASKGNPMIKKMLCTYNQLKFQSEDGSLNETISPVYQTKDLLALGMQLGNKLQRIGDMIIYPTDVLSPKNLFTNITTISPNTYAIHHFDGSWVSGERLKQKERRIKEAEEIQKMMQ